MANDLFDEVEYDKALKSLVDNLSKMDVDKQRRMVEDLCFQSTALALKVAIQLIKNVKDIDNDMVKSDESFLNLCDRGIESLLDFTKDENLSDDETKQAVDAITAILKLANENQIIMSAVMNGFDGAFTALGLKATTISKDIE